MSEILFELDVTDVCLALATSLSALINGLV